MGTVGTTAYQAAALKSVVFGGTYVGSVVFYDAATTAGTTAGNQVFSTGLPLLNQYVTVPINARLRNGLVITATGTPGLLVTFE